MGSRMRHIHAELRGELLGEVAVRIAAVEARTGVIETTISAELQRIGKDSNARLERLEAANLDSRLTCFEFDQKWKAANESSCVCDEKNKTSDGPACKDILSMTAGRTRSNSVSRAPTPNRTSSCSPRRQVTRSAVMSRQTSVVLPNLLSTVRTSQSAPRVVLKGAKLQDQNAEVESHEAVAHVAALPCNSEASVCCNVASGRSTCSRSIIASTEHATGGSPLGTGGSLPPNAPQLVACGSYVPLVTRHPQLTRIALPASVGRQQGSSGSWSARARLGVL